jgi:hypothetical protein
VSVQIASSTETMTTFVFHVGGFNFALSTASGREIVGLCCDSNSAQPNLTVICIGEHDDLVMNGSRIDSSWK